MQSGDPDDGMALPYQGHKPSMKHPLGQKPQVSFHTEILCPIKLIVKIIHHEYALTICLGDMKDTTQRWPQCLNK